MFLFPHEEPSVHTPDDTPLNKVRHIGSFGWMRDLIREGIEPNPGPSWDVIVSQLKTQFSDEKDWELLQRPLAEIKNAARELEFPITEDTVKLLIKKYRDDPATANALHTQGVTNGLIKLLDETVNAYAGTILFYSPSIRLLFAFYSCILLYDTRLIFYVRFLFLLSGLILIIVPTATGGCLPLYSQFYG